MCMKVSFLIICMLLFVGSLFANKPDSVYIYGPRIQFIYLTDSIPTVRVHYFNQYYSGHRFASWLLEAEIDEDRPAHKAEMSNWMENPHRLFAYDDLAFNKNYGAVLDGNQLGKYIFFAPDRYAAIDTLMSMEYEERDFIRCYTNNWVQYSIDSLNILLLFNAEAYITYKSENSAVRIDDKILPLKGNRYFSDRTDNIETLQPDTMNGDYRALLWSRRNIFDVDTFSVNGKYGLYTTLTKKEVIPAIYDFMETDEVFIRAFDGRKAIIFDYMGNVVKDNIRHAYPILFRYQVLDNNNRVYWLDRDVQEHDSYKFNFTSTDNTSGLFPFDIALTPPQNKGKNRNYHWIKFTRLNEEQDKKEYSTHDLQKCGIDKLIAGYNKEWSLPEIKDKLSEYDIVAFKIPQEYKNPSLVNGESKYRRQYRSLNGNFVVAKYKGMYGVVDVMYPEAPVLPFVYDKIETNTGISLTLHKDGLKCYYPISKTPRYKELSPFLLLDYYIRFTLHNGEEGWLSKDGEEFFDNEPKTVEFEYSIYTEVDKLPELFYDSCIIRKYANDTTNFKSFDDFRRTEKGLVRQKLKSLQKSLSKGSIGNQTLNTLLDLKSLPWMISITDKKYKNVDEGILLTGRRVMESGLSDPRYEYRTYDLYFIGFDNKVLVLNSKTTRRSRLKAVDAVITIDTLAISHTFPTDKYEDANLVLPCFVGKNQTLTEYAKENLIYPVAAIELDIKHKVTVTFTILPDGTIQDEEILRMNDPILDKEVLRFVKSMQGMWTPGTLNGRNVPVKISIPIIFDLLY